MSIGNRIYAELRGDRAIWMIVAILALFSILSVYSATGTIAHRIRGGNTEFYLIKQVLMITGGLFLTYIAYMLHYAKYKVLAPYLIIIAIPLLIYTILFGAEINDARRWIEVPFFAFTIQTSEFAKLALIIYVAKEISKRKDYIKDFNTAFLPIIVPVLLVCSLIAPADLSTAILLFVTAILMMFIGRVAVQYILLLLFLGIVVFSFLIIIGNFFPDVVRVETWISRMREFMQGTGDTYQIDHSMIAIANGGIFGQGPGNSVLRNYLPAPYSDFIYATIIEEYGMIGGFLILILYVFLFVRTVRLITRSPKTFGAMLALGVSLILVLQAMANIAVSVNLVPVTGLTLPLVSMGGTSLIFSSICFGILLSVSRYIEKVT